MSSESGRRAVAVDALFGFAVFAVVAIAVGSDVADPGVDEPLVVDRPALGYLIAVMLGALMFWRRTRPVAVLLATGVLIVANYVLDLPIIGLAVPLAPALYSAAEADRTRWAVGTATGLLLLSTGVRLAQGQDPAFVLGYELASTVAIMGAAIALGHIQVQRRRAGEQRMRIAELDRQAARAEAAERVSLERTRIARDLHDAVGHRLTVVMLHSSVAVEALEGDRPDLDTARTELGYVTDYSRAGLRELRSTVHALRGSDSEVAGTASLAYLDDLTAEVRAAGLTVDVRGRPERGDLPALVDATAHRVVQEALTNTLKHARARSATVEFTVDGEDLTVSVADDGATPAGDEGTGSGLAGMRERVRLLGGELETGPRPDGGFLVRARLPIGGPR
ncbi:sensor histidine kinase [Nocardiopsis sp. HNM0947]|uniref:histidine kinase n=1 Tax=Nocardiopsis coralli TaxID=2772213 RepID=A0ABR9P2Q6_9ACTN|nr:sensor histidine kinase [Nocardiopsis coralli]MBE2998127.1 sensor histidine kinase [Nocardiopsis coralli]